MTTYINNIIKNNLQILLVFFVLFLSINSKNINFIDISLYLFLHIAIVYQSVYSNSKLNFYHVFIIAFILDLVLINNFGPHLIILIFAFFFIKKIKKLFINNTILFQSLINITIIFSIILLEKLFAMYLYEIKFNFLNIVQALLILLTIYYPSYLFLNLLRRN